MLTEPSSFTRFQLIFLAALALYIAAYFPTASYLVRHPKYQRAMVVFRPIPGLIKHPMFLLWRRLDPDGFAIVERQASYPASAQ